MLQLRLVMSEQRNTDAIAHIAGLSRDHCLFAADDLMEDSLALIARIAISLWRDRHDTDVIITYGTAALKAASLASTGRPIIDIVEGVPSKTHRALARRQARRGSYWFVTSSAAVASLAIRTVTDARSVRVIRPTPGAATQTRDDVRARLGVKPTQPLIYIPGRPRRGSNHRLALWATGILAFQNPEVRVLLESPDDSIIRFAASTQQGHAIRVADELNVTDRALAADVAICTADAATEWTALAAIAQAGVPIVALQSLWDRDRLHQSVPASTLIQLPKARLFARAAMDLLDRKAPASVRVATQDNTASEWNDLLDDVIAMSKETIHA